MGVNVLKQKVPGITIATDIICGFPTETEDDFDDTMRICKKYKFPVLYINQFYPRPGTPAAKMKRVASTQEVKQRTKKLTEFFHSYEPYKQILVPKDESLMGKLVNVEIVESSKFSMVG